MAQIKTNLQYGVTGTVQSANIANDAIDSQHYADGSLDTAHIADDQVTLAKMAAGTDGNIITYDASGNPAVVAVGTSGHFLKSQGAGSVPVFAAAGGGKILQAVSRTTTTSTATTDHASYTATDLYVAITPTLSSSKILYMLNGRISMYEGSGSGVRNRSIVYRDIVGGGYSANFPSTQDITWGIGGGHFSSAELGTYHWMHMSFLDSPNTTSACTYKLYIKKDVASGSGDSTTLGGSSAVMSILALEVDNA